jgi:hypothetical protein
MDPETHVMLRNFLYNEVNEPNEVIISIDDEFVFSI